MTSDFNTTPRVSDYVNTPLQGAKNKNFQTSVNSFFIK